MCLHVIGYLLWIKRSEEKEKENGKTPQKKQNQKKLPQVSENNKKSPQGNSGKKEALVTKIEAKKDKFKNKKFNKKGKAAS